MKCLTILQPWASLLLCGVKRYETRSWRTRHRGRLAIHAGQKLTLEAQALCGREPFRSALLRVGFRDCLELPRGQVLGTVELVGCLPTEDLTDLTPAEKSFGDFRPGRWAWVCLRPRLLPFPIPWPGNVGVFDLPEDLFDRK